MQVQIQKPQIIEAFRFYGLILNNNCLRLVQKFLSQSDSQHRALDGLIERVNEMTTSSNQPFGQRLLNIAIQMISQGLQTRCKTYEQIVQDFRKWSIMYISPYETKPERFFVQKPDPQMFKFNPQQIMSQDISRFKQIQAATKAALKSNNQWFVGILYQDFTKLSNHNDISKSKFTIQNQANEAEIIFPENYQHKYPLIPGCIYAIRGKYLNSKLVMTVDQLILPPPLTEQKDSLVKEKFKKICDTLHSLKNQLIFQAKDFLKYTTIYNEQRDVDKSTLIFGSVKVQKQVIQRILRLISMFNNKVQCIILMLDEGQHQQIDLKIWFKGISVFVIPHINNEGPRLLPKVPILKKNFNCTKVLTNPAKFSFYGRQNLFLNLPVMKSLYEKNLLNSKVQSVNFNQQQMGKSVSQLLFSQSSVQICSQNFPKQTDYFKIKQQTILFISDKACPLMQNSKDKEGKKNLFVSVGNFTREGDFVCYMPKNRKIIQLCQQPKN